MAARREHVIKTVASLLLGAASALALFLAMHLLIDEPPQFIDPIVEVFELPVSDVPDARQMPQQRRQPPATPQRQRQRLAQVPPMDIPAVALSGSHLPAGAVQLDTDRGQTCGVRVSAEYPREQLLDGTEGWDDVHFTVQADGSVTDAVAADASPSRVFDRAALSAISHWHCDPRVVDGTAVARRESQRIEFRTGQ